ncbi:diacylglycerol kinase family lipid kinase [Sphingomonas ginkgonis]|uniref:Diacylglycerol kinase family lipid kinase n=2 Tax=Sphingomonas ginkgonis TaxID=2315330 RepID=A0A3R9X6I6_9SPHN|nr:diacylglycerol kinase family lipid kinase [Sphingomonas ginkgonis]
MKAIVIVNKGGGSADGDAPQRLEAALADAGVEAEIVLVEGARCAERAAEALKQGRTPICAAGGDGTISAVAGALAGADEPLGVLPLGTLNHFAKDIGMPADLAEAAKVIAAGKTRLVDVAELNGRIFINNSAIGLYPLMVLDRDNQREKLGRSKRLAMLVAGVRTLVRFRHHRLSLTINEEQRATLDTPLLFVGNNDYELSLPQAGQRQTLDDGKLCVMILRSKSRAGLMAATLRALAGRVRSDDMIRLDDVTRLRVASRRSHLTVAIDGETEMMRGPLDYRIRPASLKVICP